MLEAPCFSFRVPFPLLFVCFVVLVITGPHACSASAVSLAAPQSQLLRVHFLGLTIWPLLLVMTMESPLATRPAHPRWFCRA